MTSISRASSVAFQKAALILITRQTTILGTTDELIFGNSPPSIVTSGYGGTTNSSSWAAEVGLDEYSRTVMLYWQRQGDPLLYLYEMIQISDDGQSRCRTWHWIRDGKLETRTAIQEKLVTKDWRSLEGQTG